MKTAKAIELAAQEQSTSGGTKTGQQALADLLEITPSAVSQWHDEVPKPREWQLRVLKPEWFVEQKASARAKAKAA